MLNFNIWIKELDDGWLQVRDGRKIIATAWDLWSVRVFVQNYKDNAMIRYATKING